MKRVIFTGSLVLLLSIFSFAQKQGRPVSDPEASARSNGRLQLESGSSIQAELQNAVDVKNSKVGDQVILKTTRAIKQGRETVVPKGANLIGRITQVQQRTKENSFSRIGMVFDRIEGKNLSAPINASIVSITSAQAAAGTGDTMDTGLSGGTSSSGSISRGGGGSGGGLLGGVTSTVGGVADTAVRTAGGITNTAGQTVSGTTGTLRGTLGGIQISQSASGSARSSTTLSSPNRNIRLEKGVTFQLQVNN